MKQFIVLIFIAMLAGSCKRGEEAALTFIKKFSGAPYTGRVTVVIEVPGQQNRHDYGRASLQLLDSTGNIARLVLFGAIDEGGSQAGDVGFVLGGKYTDTEWHFRQHPLRLEINEHGTVSGEMETADERYTYTGTISPTVFSIKTVVQRLTPTQGGYPAGTIFTFEHSGQRDDPSAPPGGSNGGGCRNIQWQLRNVWNPGGGAMSLVRVPVCYD